ncbi:hypothetical protein ACFXN2_06085 [Streptomyces kronopolitis]|uniref:hypothetical protein n=1 Tax=Streptomyces kronopolitis TaxID=1612435 RepID=UPI0036CEE8A9
MNLQEVHVVTVASDESRAQALFVSAARMNIPVTNLGRNVAWHGGDMTGPGGGQKLNLMRPFLDRCADTDIVLFVDGYDVLLTQSLEQMLKRFARFQADVVFGAERICWPDQQIAPRFAETASGYRFLNSGVYMGYAFALKEFLAPPIADAADDQLYMQHQYLHYEGSHLRPALDTRAELFQCLSAAGAEVSLTEDKLLHNSVTDNSPGVLHGNGGWADKQAFEQLCKNYFTEADEIVFQAQDQSHEVLERDIIAIDFLTPEDCTKLLHMAEAQGQWKAMPGDNFPGQEMRIRALDVHLYNRLETHFRLHINPILTKYWAPMTMHGLRDVFIIKYSPGSQRSLACHVDASLVSGIVKLNDDYEGGDTYFYRQGYSTKDLAVGKMALWPGQVTHGHEGREVTSGTKYALVIWTGRYKGDVLNP